MKKFYLFLIAFLLIGVVFAQSVRMSSGVKPQINLTATSLNDVAIPTQPTGNRAVIYEEGFESTSGDPGGLPIGWTKSGGTWITMSDADVWTSPYGNCGDPFAPHSGTRMMGREWYNSGNYWVFSSGFTLTEGETYEISFWFSAPGWPAFLENDDFELRIGQTATAGGMASAHLVYQRVGQNTAPFPYDWTKATGTFTPTTSGTYYLGFHDLNPDQTGLWIIIDDIKISSKCPAVTAVTATYDDAAKEVVLTWVAPESLTPKAYQIYKDDDPIGSPITQLEYKEDLSTLESGDYAFKYCVLPIYDDGVCDGDIAKVCDEVSFVLGIKNYTSTFSIVPNPATNNITITAKGNFNNIEVLNFLGQVVASQPNAGNKAVLDISNLTNGVYFVRTISDNGTSVQKFVKR